MYIYYDANVNINVSCVTYITVYDKTFEGENFCVWTANGDLR